jgi:polysaccharide biosynthesis protein PslH
MDIEVIFPSRSRQNVIRAHNLGQNITLRTYSNLQKIPLLPERTRLLLDEYCQALNPFIYTPLRRNFRNKDLLFAHFPMAFLATYFAIGNKLPIIYVAHNFEYGTLRQTTRNPLAWKIIYEAEKFACSKATKVLCVSEQDKSKLQNTFNLLPEKIMVFPNTVDVDFFSQTTTLFDKQLERRTLGINPGSFTLLFSGRMDYRPNTEALKFILNQLLPAVEALGGNLELMIVGAQIPTDLLKLKLNNIHFYSNVPDVRRFYAVANAAIVPISSGGGTRIKILEAFATKLPVISTETGCEGIGCHDREHFLRAQRTPEDFIDKVNTLINDTKIRDKIITNAYDLVNQEYSTVFASANFQKLIAGL